MNLPPVLAADLAVLRQQPMATLALWYCELNTWFWPAALPDPPADTYKPSDRTKQIMDWIRAVVGEYEISRFWNVEYGGTRMSEAAFERWWREER